MSLLLHALLAVMLFLFLSTLFRSPSIGLLSAVLFTAPLGDRMVVNRMLGGWWPGQGDILAGVFYVASLLAAVVWLRGQGRGYRILSLVLFLLAIAAKELAYTLPLMLVAVAVYEGRRKVKEIVGIAWPHFALALAMGVIRTVAVGPGWSVKYGLATSLCRAGSFLAEPLLHKIVMGDWWPVIAGVALAGFLAAVIKAPAMRKTWVLLPLLLLLWGGLAVVAQWAEGAWQEALFPGLRPWANAVALAVFLLLAWLVIAQKPKEVFLAVAWLLITYAPTAVILGGHYVYFPGIGWAVINALVITAALQVMTEAWPGFRPAARVVIGLVVALAILSVPLREMPRLGGRHQWISAWAGLALVSSGLFIMQRTRERRARDGERMALTP
jgi:hypothetical protein